MAQLRAIKANSKEKNTAPRGEHSPLKGAAEKMGNERPELPKQGYGKDPRSAVLQRAAELKQHEKDPTKGNVDPSMKNDQGR